MGYAVRRCATTSDKSRGALGQVGRPLLLRCKQWRAPQDGIMSQENAVMYAKMPVDCIRLEGVL